MKMMFLFAKIISINKQLNTKAFLFATNLINKLAINYHVIQIYDQMIAKVNSKC